MYVIDRATKSIVGEWRAAEVLRARIGSIADYAHLLGGAFQLLPEEIDYRGRDLWDYAHSGWLHAWAPDVVGQLDVPLDIRWQPRRWGRQTGWVEWHVVEDRAPDLTEDLRSRLPPLGRETMMAAAERFDVSRVGDTHVPRPMRRHIPSAVVGEVRRRAAGRCQWPGCLRTKDLQIDHRWPFALGGSHDPDNLQVLCRPHNLAKSDSVLDGIQPPAALAPAERVAIRIDAPAGIPPRNVLIRACGIDTTDPELVAARYDLALAHLLARGTDRELHRALDASGDVELAALGNLFGGGHADPDAQWALAERGSETARLAIGLNPGHPGLTSVTESAIPFVAGLARYILACDLEPRVARPALAELLEWPDRFVAAEAACRLASFTEDPPTRCRCTDAPW